MQAARASRRGLRRKFQQLHVSFGSFRGQCGVCMGLAKALDKVFVGDSVGLAGLTKTA